MRYAYRRDDNEHEVEEVLNAYGYQTWTVDNCPFDMLVWRTGVPRFLLLEVKTKRGRLTKQQATFFSKTEGCPRLKVNSPQEALAAANEVLRAHQWPLAGPAA